MHPSGNNNNNIIITNTSPAPTLLVGSVTGAGAGDRKGIQNGELNHISPTGIGMVDMSEALENISKGDISYLHNNNHNHGNSNTLESGIKVIQTDHQDYLLDICYDFHGRRLATCSADRTVKVWNRVNEEWVLDSTLPDAGVRVDWAHPEFGSIIASCSDQFIIIWEEMVLSTPGAGGNSNSGNNTNSNNNNTSAGAAQSNEENNFAGSSNAGISNNNNNQIQSTSLSSAASLGASRTLEPSTSASSSTSSTSSTSSSSHGFGKRWKEAARISQTKGSKSLISIKFSPRHLGLQLAVCSDDGFVRIYRASDPTTLSKWEAEHEFDASSQSLSMGKSHSSSTGITCVSWNPSQLDRSSMLVLGTAYGSVMIWRLDGKKRKWQMMVDLTERDETKMKMQKDEMSTKKPSHGEDSAIINEVSWAPNMGRSFHLIASAAGNGTIKIWKLVLSNSDDGAIESIHTETLKHGSEAWKVEWNVTGTVLTTSGDDGEVRLWKCDYTPLLFSSASLGSRVFESTWKPFARVTE